MKRDKRLIAKSDAFVAEVSTNSHGVGYEHCYAQTLGKPILLLRHMSLRSEQHSAFLDGSDYGKLTFKFYDRKNIMHILGKFLFKDSRKPS